MMTPKDAEAVKDKNPYLAYLAGDPRGRAFSQLLQSIPRDQFDVLFAENRADLSLKIDQLPPQPPGFAAERAEHGQIIFDSIHFPDHVVAGLVVGGAG